MLEKIDLTRSLDEGEYKHARPLLQRRLYDLQKACWDANIPTVIVFEGWDAAGKGGAIRRITEKLDPRGFVVYPIAAPKGDEATHHYLWRFWNKLPEAGQMAIFDRSWYGRVMVERIEGFCNEADWKRAYREINYFERQLVDFGTILFKFWLHISADEQLRRFESRDGDKRRSWKLTDEDWRNREKWYLYEAAVNEMLLKTSTLAAPWTVVEGNSKAYARIKILRTLVEKLSQELKYDPYEVETTAKKKDKDKDKDKKKRKKDA